LNGEEGFEKSPPFGTLELYLFFSIDVLIKLINFFYYRVHIKPFRSVGNKGERVCKLENEGKDFVS
jgi:hypothetical protein